MASKLVQKSLFRGTREFEIVDDVVNVRIKTPFNKEETLTVMLTVLNPEPVISKSLLAFTSRVNNEPLLSLYLAKPNPEEFNAFVNLLKQKAHDEFNAFAGLKSSTPSGLGLGGIGSSRVMIRSKSESCVRLKFSRVRATDARLLRVRIPMGNCCALRKWIRSSAPSWGRDLAAAVISMALSVA